MLVHIAGPERVNKVEKEGKEAGPLKRVQEFVPV